MADFLDRLGDELMRAMQAPTDAADPEAAALERSRRRAAAHLASSHPFRAPNLRVGAAALSSLVLIGALVAALAIVNPFASPPHPTGSGSGGASKQQAIHGGARGRVAQAGVSKPAPFGPAAGPSQSAPPHTGKPLPAGIRLISITVQEHGRMRPASRTLTDRALVLAAVRLVESMPRGRRQLHPCRQITGAATIIRLLFRHASAASPLARLTIERGACDAVSLTVHGQPVRPPLAGGPQAVRRLQRLLKTNL